MKVTGQQARKSGMNSVRANERTRRRLAHQIPDKEPRNTAKVSPEPVAHVVHDEME
jgi:hypothetical protein